MGKASAKRATRRSKHAPGKAVHSSKIAAPVVVPATGAPNLAALFLKTPSRERWLVALLAGACLLPFLNKAFHIDDPLFLWAARHIVGHPLDPYGFPVVWYRTAMPMSKVMKNPPSLPTSSRCLDHGQAGLNQSCTSCRSCFALPGNSSRNVVENTRTAGSRVFCSYTPQVRPCY